MTEQAKHKQFASLWDAGGTGAVSRLDGGMGMAGVGGQEIAVIAEIARDRRDRKTRARGMK